MSELPIRRYEGSVHVVAGHPDLQELYRALVDWSAELRLLGAAAKENNPKWKAQC